MHCPPSQLHDDQTQWGLPQAVRGLPQAPGWGEFALGNGGGPQELVLGLAYPAGIFCSSTIAMMSALLTTLTSKVLVGKQLAPLRL